VFSVFVYKSEIVYYYTEFLVSLTNKFVAQEKKKKIKKKDGE